MTLRVPGSLGSSDETPAVSIKPDTPPVTERNVYDDILDQEEDDRRISFNIAAIKSYREDPDERAQILNMSNKTQLPPDLVARQKHIVERQLYTQQMRELYERQPKMSQWLEQGDHLTLAKDDLEILESLASILVTDDDLIDASHSGMWSPDVRKALIERAESLGGQVERRFESSEEKRDRATQTVANAHLRRVHQQVQMKSEVVRDFLPDLQLYEAHREKMAEHSPGNVYLPSETRNAKEVLADLFENPWKAMPFFSAVPEVTAALDLYGAMTRFAEDRETFADIKLLLEVDNDIKRGGTFWAGTLDLMVEVPAFGAEIAFTGGLYTAGRKGAQKTTQELLERWMSKVISKKSAGITANYGSRAVGSISGAALQGTVGLQHRNIAETLRQMTPGVGAEIEDGEIQKYIFDTGDSFMLAMAKGSLSGTIEVWGNTVAGSLLQRGMSRIPMADKLASVRAALAARWLRSDPTRTWNQFTAKIASEAQWHGVIAEIGEEEVIKILRYATTLDDVYQFTSGEEFAQMLIAFSAFPAARTTVGVGLSARYQAEAAERQQTFFDALAGQVSQSKLEKRMPQAMQSFIAEMTKDGPVENIYIDPQAWVSYYQSVGMDPRQAAIDVLGNADPFDQALDAGHDMVVPTSVYAARIAPTDVHEALREDLRLSPDMMTSREARTWAQTMEDARREQRRMNEEEARDVQSEQTAQQIREGVEAQLTEAGFEPGTAHRYSLLFERGINAMAERSGMSAGDLMQRHSPQFVRGLANAPRAQQVQDPPVDRESDRPTNHRTISRAEIERRLVDLAGRDMNLDDSLAAGNAEQAESDYQQQISTAFAGPLPTELTDALEGKTHLLSFVRANQPKGHGMDTMHAMGVDKFVEMLEAMQISKLRAAKEVSTGAMDHHPEAAFYAHLLENWPRRDKGVETQTIENPDQSLLIGDTLKIFGQQYEVGSRHGDKVLLDESGNPVTYLSALKDMPVDAGSIQAVALPYFQTIDAGTRDADGSDRVEVSEVPAQDLAAFPADMTMPQLRDAIRPVLKERLAGRVETNEHTGWDIAIPWQGLKHASSRGSFREQLVSLLATPDLIRRAVLVDTQPDAKGRNTIRAFHTMVAPLRIDGKIYRAVLVVREHQDGKHFYDQAVVEMTTPSPGKANQGLRSLQVLEGVDTLSINDLLSESNAVDRHSTGRDSQADGKTLYQSAAEAGVTSAQDADAARQAWAEQGVDSPWFKRWFGESKVVDDGGKPLVVYHGTPDARHFSGNHGDAVFQTFQQRYRGALTPEGQARADEEAAYFFTTNRQTARTYATDKPAFDYQNSEPGVVGAYLSIKNPMIVDAEGKAWGKRGGPVTQAEQIAEAKAKGHDGMVIRNTRDTYNDTRRAPQADIYVAFSPEQIKSATDNQGTFDPSNPSILFQSAVDGGPVFHQFKHDATGAIAALNEAKAGEAIAALHHPEVGDIDLIWGKAGRDGYGLSKIQNRHPEVMADLQGFIEGLTLKERNSNSVILESSDGRAMVRLNWLGEPKRWLLTAYAKKEGPTQSDSTIDGAGNLEGEAGRQATQPLVEPDSSIAPTSSEVKDFHQARGNDKRGAIRIGHDRQMTVEFFEKADLSTFLHETGHMFLEIFADLATDPYASDQMKQDWQTVLDWMKVQDRKGIQVKQHEQWAQAFEAYLMEGKAPSTALQRAFSAFRVWLNAIYKTLSGRGVKLNDDVRRVMDRMLATDAEIAQAQAEANITPMFTDAERSGMTDLQFEKYQQAVTDAREAAQIELQAKLMQSLARERKKAWRDEEAQVRSEVEAEYHVMPEYIALANMQKGRMPDGTPLPAGVDQIKLSKAELVERFGPAILDQLPGPRNPNHRGAYLYSRDGGIGIDLAAELFGFASGDKLVEALVSTLPMRDAVSRETRRRMDERYPDPALDGSIQEDAKRAIHNEKRSALLKMELEHLFERHRAVFKDVVRRVSHPMRMPDMQIIKDQAGAIVGSQSYRDLRPGLYMAAQSRASKAAVDAMLRGDLEEAFKQKMRETLNHELYRAATQARERADEIATYMRKFERNNVRATIGKAGHDYLQQIDSLMERYEFAVVPFKQLDRRRSMEEWIENIRKESPDIETAPEIDVRLFNEADRRNYRELPVEMLEAVYDAVKQIEHFASLKNRLLKQKNLRDLEEAVDAAVSAIERNVKRKSDPTLAAERTAAQKAVDKFEGFIAAHRKVASYARQMDGGVDGGVLWQLLVRPLNEAADTEVGMRREAAQNLANLFSQWGKGMGLKNKMHIPAIGRSLNMESRIMVALNWGNDGNRERLMAGEQWSQSQVQAVLDTLDAKDLALVQGIFDMIDAYWPKVKAKEQRVRGIAPDKVEASEIVTANGTIKGGYFPVVYDPVRSPRAAQLSDKEAAKLYYLGKATSATTKRGHTKQRGAGLGKPLLLSMDVVSQHVAQVVHDLTHHEALIDFNRLLRNDRFSTAIHNHLGRHAYKQMQNMIQDVAISDMADNYVDTTLRYIRNGVSVAVLGFNVSTALIQLTGIGQSMNRVGVKPFARGVARMFHDPDATEGSFAFIEARSQFMRDRRTTMMREVNEVVNTVRGKGRKQTLNAWAYWLLVNTQYMVDAPTWMAGYENARNRGFSESDASAMADQAVIDSQMSGHRKDFAGVQRSPLGQLFTVLYGYFNASFNLSAESIAMARNNNWSPNQIARLVKDFVLLISVPAVMGAFIQMYIRGDGDHEEDHAFGKAVLNEHLSLLTATGPVGFRDVGGVLTGFPYRGPASLRGFHALGRLITEVQQGELDKGLVDASIDTVGVFGHLPTGQLRKLIDGYIYMQETGEQDPRPLIFGAPRK